MAMQYDGEFNVGLNVATNTGSKWFWLDNEDIYNLYFIEDLYSYYPVGKLIFRDKIGIFELGSYVADTYINIYYGDTSPKFYSFIAYKINRILPSGPNTQGTENTVEIIFSDLRYYSNISRIYSKSWKNTKGTDIIKDILKFDNVNSIEQITSVNNESPGIDNISEIGTVWVIDEDESNENLDFVIPYWTAHQTLNWILPRLSTGNPKKWGYCCYTTMYDGRWRIKTLENLLNQNSIIKGDPNQGTFEFNPEEQFAYNRILSYEWSGTDNFSHRDIRGGHREGFDFERKKLINREYKYSDTVDKFTHLGKWTLFRGTEYSRLPDEESGIKLYGDENEDIVDNLYYNDWIKRYCMQNTLEIIVKGHENRYPGGLIHIKWPSLSDEKKWNLNYSGLYLIKSITHNFNPAEKPIYRQKIALIRNAYDYDNMKEEFLKPARKKNTIRTKSSSFGEA